VALLEGIRTHQSGAAAFDLSNEGTLVYAATSAGSQDRLLAWVDRKGQATPASQHRRAYTTPRISHDGAQVLVAIGNQTTLSQIWMLDLRRDTLALKSDTGSSVDGLLSPDGESILYGGAHPGSLSWDVYARSVNAGPNEPSTLLLRRPGFQVLTDLSPDGRIALIIDGGGNGRLALLDMESGDFELAPGDDEQVGNARLSPDGRWIAYDSEQSGVREVYVRPLRDSGAPIQISRQGGSNPVWARDGGELYFRRGRALLAVHVDPGGEFLAASEQLFEIADVSATLTNYDIAADGRFLMVLEEASGEAPGLSLVTHWMSELRARLAAGSD